MGSKEKPQILNLRSQVAVPGRPEHGGYVRKPVRAERSTRPMAHDGLISPPSGELAWVTYRAMFRKRD